MDHPTLFMICNAMVRQQLRYGETNVVIFKEDVRGFYQLCEFSP